MPFLGISFKKKPGGTFFGNLLRGGASALSGGLLGQGKNMLPPIPPKDLTPEGEQAWLERWYREHTTPVIPRTRNPNEPLIDLSNLIKLPTVNVDAGEKTSGIVKTVVFGLIGFFLLKMIFGNKSRH